MIDLFAADPPPAPAPEPDEGGEPEDADPPVEATGRGDDRHAEDGAGDDRAPPMPVGDPPPPASPDSALPAGEDPSGLGDLAGIFARLGIVPPEEEQRFYGEDQRPTPVWMPREWARALPVSEARIRGLRERLAELRRRTATGACLLWPWQQEYELAAFPEAPLIWPRNAYARHVREAEGMRARAQRLRALTPTLEELSGVLEATPAADDPWAAVPDPVALAFPWGSLVLETADRAFAPPGTPLPRIVDMPSPAGTGDRWLAWRTARRVELAVRRERLDAQMRLLARVVDADTRREEEQAAAALREGIRALEQDLAAPASFDARAMAALEEGMAAIDAAHARLRERLAARPGAAAFVLPGSGDPTAFLEVHLETAARVCAPLRQRLRLYRQLRSADPDAAALLIAGLDRELAMLAGRCRLLVEDLARLAGTEPGKPAASARAHLESRIAGQMLRLLEAAVFYRLRSAQRLSVLALRLQEATGNGDDASLAEANRDIAYDLRSREVTNEPEGWLDPPGAIRLLFEWQRLVPTDRPDVLAALRDGQRELLAELEEALADAETRLWRLLDGGVRTSCGADLRAIEDARRAGEIDADTARIWREAVAARFAGLRELARVRPSKRLFLLTSLAPEVRGALPPGVAFPREPGGTASGKGDASTRGATAEAEGRSQRE